MTPEQLKLYRERLTAGRKPEHKLVDTRDSLRGWNEGLAYAEKCLREVTLNLKASQFTGLMQDKTETDDDKRDATQAAKTHMEGVLAMLRGRG